jgi:hypothetical protein
MLTKTPSPERIPPMNNIVTVTILLTDGTDVEMKLPKTWNTRTGKRKAMDNAIRTAMLTFPNYTSIQGRWAPDLTWKETDGLITFRPVDPETHSVLGFVARTNEIQGEWVSDKWEYRTKEYEGYIRLNRLREAGLEVANA